MHDLCSCEYDACVHRRSRRVLEQLLEPDRLWSWSALVQDPDVIPSSGGVYGWYFTSPPPGVPTRDCHRRQRRVLLYVGISPGRRGSSGTLQSRLRYHFSGNSSGSTLRKTLGCLLRHELQLDFRRFRSGRTVRFTPEGEERLSEWMSTHARVTWSRCVRPWEVERDLISALSLPLNLESNQAHPFYSTLRHARADMLDHARRRPVWRG